MGWRWRWGRPRAYKCLTSFRTLPAACIENGGLNMRRSKQHNTHETVPPHSVSSLVAILVARGTGGPPTPLSSKTSRKRHWSKQTNTEAKPKGDRIPAITVSAQARGTGRARGTGHGGRTSGPAADADCEWEDGKRHRLARGSAAGLGGPWVQEGGAREAWGQGAGGRGQWAVGRA